MPTAAPRARANPHVPESAYRECMTGWIGSSPIALLDMVGDELCKDSRAVTPMTLFKLHGLFRLFLKAGLTSCILLTTHLDASLKSLLPSSSCASIIAIRDHIQLNFAMLRLAKRNDTKASAFMKRLTPTDHVLMSHLLSKVEVSIDSCLQSVAICLKLSQCQVLAAINHAEGGTPSSSQPASARIGI